MSTHIRCKLCDAQASIPDTPGLAGWTSLAVSAPIGNRYLVACPAHTTSEVVAATKKILDGKA